MFLNSSMKPSWRAVTWQFLRKAGVAWVPNQEDLGFVTISDNVLCSFWDILDCLFNEEWT